MRKAVPRGVRVLRAGIGAANARGAIAGIAISCGVAGGLRPDLPTGTVLVPEYVYDEDRNAVRCDPQLVQTFLSSARKLGYTAVAHALLTSRKLVRGAERLRWAGEGYAGVDMESARIDAGRLACVRVILDTPLRELSPAWERPASVFFHPGAWKDVPFLARHGPACAAIAAAVIADGLRSTPARSASPQ